MQARQQQGGGGGKGNSFYGGSFTQQQRPRNFGRAVPTNYICHRCNKKGHWIYECPTNGDPKFDRPKQAVSLLSGAGKYFQRPGITITITNNTQ